MNIQTQCCGIIVLLVIYSFYRRQNKVNLDTEKAYWRVFCVTAVCLCMDIISVIAIINRDKLPLFALHFICKTYLVSMIIVALSNLLYIYADLYSKSGKYQLFIKKYIVLAAFGGVMIYILPIYIYHEGNSLYSYGPSALATYFFALTFLVMNLYSMIKHKNMIRESRREAVFVWMIVWVLAALIQFVFKELLLVGYAFVIGIMILYLKLENPEQNLDRKTGLFNQNAFAEYIQQLYAQEQKFSLLSLHLEELFKQNAIEKSAEEAIQTVSRYLMSIPDARAFKYAEDEVILLFKDKGYAKLILEEIQEHFNGKWGEDETAAIRLRGFFVPNMQILANASDIPVFLRYVRENSTKYTESLFLTVEETIMHDMYKELEIEQKMLRAIEEKSFEVQYQPIYSIEEKKFTCAEALVRLRDDDQRLIPPAEFIGVAERNGLIIKLGEAVFEKVCHMWSEQNPEIFGLQYVEVNLSVVQCTYPGLADDFISIMKKYGVNPTYINLEITESASLEAKNILLSNMKTLMDYGVHFSLDDFGTGQSNLNYIVDMPVHIVKFDKTMTDAYFANGKAKYVMEAAMHMIHGMNLAIVSEGIETKEQLDTMQSLGIRYIQGYYFSKPLYEDDFIRFLKENNRVD